jgi:hypothetical protein
MFLEVNSISLGPMLLNLNHIIAIVDASDIGGGCIIETIAEKIRVEESYSQLQLYATVYNDKSRIR